MPRIVGQYILLERIGKGRQGKVYRAIDTFNNNDTVAIKAIEYSSSLLQNNSSLPSNVQKEIFALQAVLGHPYIVTLRNIILEAFIPSKRSLRTSNTVLTTTSVHNDTTTLSSSSSASSSLVTPSVTTMASPGKRCLLLVMDLEPNGELFDYLLYSNKFPEQIARYYFRQLLSALLHARIHGIAHRDIKPENLLLNDQFQLKLSDWGLATILDNDERTGRKAVLRTTGCGTRAYMAPEIYNNIVKRPYSPFISDIWSIGIVLFTMIAGFPPLQYATNNDWWYDKIATHQWDLFWTAHERMHVFSPAIKDLFQKIFEVNPNERIDLEDIAAHIWTTGNIPDDRTVIQEMINRREAILKLKGSTLDDMLQGMEETQEYYKTKPTTLLTTTTRPYTVTSQNTEHMNIETPIYNNDNNTSSNPNISSIARSSMEDNDMNRLTPQSYHTENIQHHKDIVMDTDTETANSTRINIQPVRQGQTRTTTTTTTSTSTNLRSSNGYGFKSTALPNGPPRLGGSVSTSALFKSLQNYLSVPSTTTEALVTSENVENSNPTPEIQSVQISEVVQSTRIGKNDTIHDDNTMVGTISDSPTHHSTEVIAEALPIDGEQENIETTTTVIVKDNLDTIASESTGIPTEEEDDNISDDGEIEVLSYIPSNCLTWFPIPSDINIGKLCKFIKQYFINLGYSCIIRVHWLLPSAEYIEIPFHDISTVMNQNNTGKMSIKLKIKKLNQISKSHNYPYDISKEDIEYDNVEFDLRIYSTKSTTIVPSIYASPTNPLSSSNSENGGMTKTTPTKYISKIPTIALEASGIAHILIANRTGGNNFMFYMLFRKLRQAIEKSN